MAVSTAPADRWSTRRIATSSLLCALSFVLTFVEIPIFPPAPWLMYDPSGVISLVAGLVFGPSTGVVVAVLPWVLKTLFSFNIWGHLMAVVAGVALTLPASLMARAARLHAPRHSNAAQAAGMALGTAAAVAASVACNLVVTPLYTAVSTADVMAMIVPILLPFNLLKAALNCVLAALVKQPLAQALAA